MYTAIVDCDVLVYQSAFAAQKTRYEVTFSDGNALTFMDAKERDEYLKAEGLTKDDVQIEKFVDVLSEGIALMIADRKLEEILDEVGTRDCELYITGSGNYREQVAYTKPYKGGRVADKPVHYDAVRQHYISYHGAVVVDGMEADDMIGIRVTDDPDINVCCSIDKDLNMIAGLHYDWNKLIKYRVDEYNAHRFFLQQLLKGDTTDNIGGLPKIGDKKAELIVNTACENGGIISAWDEVKRLYQEKIGDNWLDYLNEQGRLLWIKRSKDESLWNADTYQGEYLSWV